MESLNGDKWGAYLAMRCGESSSQSCVGTEYAVPYAVPPAERSVQSIGMNFEALAALRSTDIFDSIWQMLRTARATDGKSAVHMAAVQPALVAIDLRNTVQHTDGWSTNANMTAQRHSVVEKLENIVVPVIKNILTRDNARSADLLDQTPLHSCARSGATKTCGLLLDAGADPNTQNLLGQTPLHVATIYGSVETIDLLLKHGAKRSVKDAFGASFDDYIASPGNGVPARVAKERYLVAVRAPMTDATPDPPGTPAACDANGGWETGEPPASDMERCDIDRRTRLTPDEWFQEYYMRGRPVLIQGALPLNERCGMSKANMTKSTLVNGSMACGATAYPSITRQFFCPQPCTLDSLEHGTKCKVPTYGAVRNPTTGDEPMSYYTPAAVKANIAMILPGLDHLLEHVLPDDQSKRAKRLRENIEWAKLLPPRFFNNTPPFNHLCKVYIQHGNKQIFMAGKDGGATMHYHSSAYNALFFGYKRWHLLSPRYAEISGMPVSDYVRDADKRGIDQMQCLQRAGDVLLLPRGYGHATINPYGFGVGVGALYTDSMSHGAMSTTKFENNADGKYSWLPQSFAGIPLQGSLNATTIRAAGMGVQN